MISPMTGAVSGVAVKFSHREKCPSTKIHVKMPSVDPSVSALMTAALMGSTSDPNARNISSVVVVIRITVHQRQLGEQGVDAVLFERRGATHPDRHALGRLNRPQLADLVGCVVAVLQSVFQNGDVGVGLGARISVFVTGDAALVANSGW